MFFGFFYFFSILVCFLKLKIYNLILIRLCRWVRDKKIFTRPIFGKKSTFFGLIDAEISHEEFKLAINEAENFVLKICFFNINMSISRDVFRWNTLNIIAAHKIISCRFSSMKDLLLTYEKYDAKVQYLA